MAKLSPQRRGELVRLTSLSPSLPSFFLSTFFTEEQTMRTKRGMLAYLGRVGFRWVGRAGWMSCVAGACRHGADIHARLGNQDRTGIMLVWWWYYEMYLWIYIDDCEIIFEWWTGRCKGRYYWLGIKEHIIIHMAMSSRWYLAPNNDDHLTKKGRQDFLCISTVEWRATTWRAAPGSARK